MAQVEGQGEREAALVGDCLLQELEKGLEQVWRERGRKRQPDPGLALRGLPVTADFAHTSAGVLAGSDLRHELWSGQGGGEAASVAWAQNFEAGPDTAHHWEQTSSPGLKGRSQ